MVNRDEFFDRLRMVNDQSRRIQTSDEEVLQQFVRQLETLLLADATGHGIGLNVHEDPHISKISEVELQPGNIITIEPGLYYPELGGIRIEDDILITENGAEVLSSYPKNWVIS